MKTVRDACVLQPNALDIKLSDQVQQLDELIIAEGNGEAFFAKTFITHGMLDLISEGTARLAGASSQAVFHLKQAMGGGKTHLLVGFGLLARYPEIRKKYCSNSPYISCAACRRLLPMELSGLFPMGWTTACSRNNSSGVGSRLLRSSEPVALQRWQSGVGNACGSP